MELLKKREVVELGVDLEESDFKRSLAVRNELLLTVDGGEVGGGSSNVASTKSSLQSN